MKITYDAAVDALYIELGQEVGKVMVELAPVAKGVA